MYNFNSGDGLPGIIICTYPLPGLNGGIPPGDKLGGIGTANPKGGSDEANPNGEGSEIVPMTSATLMPNILLGGPATMSVKGTGTHIGDGLPPIASKLPAKIRQGGFIEMYVLLPEIWAEPKEGEKPASLARAKKRVLDLNVWLQSFAGC